MRTYSTCFSSLLRAAICTSILFFASSAMAQDDDDDEQDQCTPSHLWSACSQGAGSTVFSQCNTSYKAICCANKEWYGIPLTFPGDGDYSNYQQKWESELDGAGVHPVCFAYFIEPQKQSMQAALALADTIPDNVAGQFAEKCAKPFAQEYGMSATSIGSYYARIAGAEQKPDRIPECAGCKIQMTGIGQVDITPSKIKDNPRYFVGCPVGNSGISWRESTEQAFSSYSSANNSMSGEYCPGQQHVMLRISAPGAVQQLNGTFNATGVQACNVDFATFAHRENHSCFAPGTLITMADGSKQPVEKVKKGDTVWNPVLRKASEVATVVVGPETTPIYQLQTASRTLKVTGRHPMLVAKHDGSASMVALNSSFTNTGYAIRMASELAVGDSVFIGDKQTEEIAKITILPIDDEQVVYNLALNEAGDSQLEHIVEADGIATGDYTIQLQVNRELAH